MTDQNQPANPLPKADGLTLARNDGAEKFKQDYEYHIAEVADRIKIQASLADRALQSLNFANGGALVALFSFVASAHTIYFDRPSLALAFTSFAFGLTMSLIAHLLAFLSQDRFVQASFLQARQAQRNTVSDVIDNDRKAIEQEMAAGQRAYNFGLGVFVVSTLSFIAGCGFALSSVI